MNGWICPICVLAWAPWVDRCVECSPAKDGARYMQPMPGYQPPYTTGDPIPPNPVVTCLHDELKETT